VLQLAGACSTSTLQKPSTVANSSGNCGDASNGKSSGSSDNSSSSKDATTPTDAATSDSASTSDNPASLQLTDDTTSTGGTNNTDSTASTTDTNDTASSGPSKPVNYNDNLKDLIKTNCTSCHVSGGDAADLTTWEEVKAAKAEIASEVAAGVMPPVDKLAAEDKKAFANWKTAGYLEFAPSATDGSDSSNDTCKASSAKSDASNP